MGLYQKGKAQEFPLLDFAPDKDPTTPGILIDIQNAIPTVKGYQILNAAQPAVVSPLPEKALGSTVTYQGSATTQFWAGGKTFLYRANAGSWAIAGGGAGFNATGWDFVQFEDDVIAVGGAGVAPQVATSATGNFAALGGSPPVGASLAVVVNSQVMLFVGNKWYGSAIGNDASWASSTQTQAGNAPITDLPGNIIAAEALYRNVVVFKQRGIWFGSYVGGASIWSFAFISNLNGTWGPNCVVALPDSVQFLGLDDFYYTTGYTPLRIPNSLKEWFFDTADPNQLPSTQTRYDPYHAVTYWYFVSKSAAVAGQPDQYVSFNNRAQKWARGYLAVTSVPTPNTQPGFINGLYFDAKNVLQGFTGAPGVMRLRTGYVGAPGKLSQLMRVRGKYNIYPTSETLQAFHVNHVGQTPINGPAGVRGADDWFNLRQTDRYHSVEFDITGTVIPQATNLDSGAEIAAIAYEWREAGDR